ncbi:hypothetical protein GBAR_LOCUS2458 [Geodia barretti]|uniref:DUF885 domain-containing protein n=1 Tax=Geodia barretti TaxID=519541 RepID=A0AA35VYC2_GEOBA|nr:hypothetical protein GBAR_LOCUS2458 [Geodia barretti]
MNQAVDALAERAIREHWDFLPTSGSRIGRHEYDGRLPDFSAGRVSRRVEELHRSLGQLSSLPADDAHGTDAEARMDRLSRSLLDMFLRRELFNLEEMRTLHNNPQRQVGYLGVGSYVQRDYAPLPDRLRSAMQVLRQAPDFLATLETLTEPELGEPVRDMAVEAYRGMASFYHTGLAAASTECAAIAPDVAAEFDAARELAAGAVSGFAQRLQDRRTRPDFAIGSDLYRRMLEVGEGVNTSLSDVLSIGQANLEQNLRRLDEAAALVAPGKSVREAVAQVSVNHPTAERLIPETRDMLEDIRQALIDHDIIGVPSEERCQVTETPSYMRYAFAAMDSPGGLEEVATEAFYYVTPVEPDWTPRQQEEWLTNFNYHTLKIISVHEVYPGHYVHNLHNRHGGGLPLVNRVATSYAFTEGWAHYTEEMMLETEYGRDDAALWLTQLLEALVRNCRYLCSLGMHTQGMTVDEATQFFQAHAYMEEHPARREALRGTFDPGYLNYTLGKLMLLKLRQDWRRQEGSAYSLRRFHDAALSWGAPPVPLLRQAMLNEPGAEIL